jgi:hypothetical protein
LRPRPRARAAARARLHATRCVPSMAQGDTRDHRTMHASVAAVTSVPFLPSGRNRTRVRTARPTIPEAVRSSQVCGISHLVLELVARSNLELPPDLERFRNASDLASLATRPILRHTSDATNSEDGRRRIETPNPLIRASPGSIPAAPPGPIGQEDRRVGGQEMLRDRARRAPSAVVVTTITGDPMEVNVASLPSVASSFGRRRGAVDGSVRAHRRGVPRNARPRRRPR